MRSFALLIAVLVGVSVSAYANMDDFSGPNLSGIWTLRDPAGKVKISFSGGELVLDLAAGADMYIKGVDGGVMFLTEPPSMQNFSLEMKLNVFVNGFMPPACHVGLVFFNEAAWAYSAWGPYAATDIRLEDCAGSSYRWRADTKVGIDQTNIPIDKDLWLKVVKTGNSLECFAKGNAGDPWVSGGVDKVLGSNYTSGNYQVGIIAKSWGGSIASKFSIDYFNIPELDTTAVAPEGKLATTWSAIRK